MRRVSPTRRSSPRRLGLEALEDRTQPSLTLSLANPALAEGGPGTAATVTRDGDLSQALSVALASGDLTEATVPPSVVIAAGAATATFAVTPVDDAVPDGTQSATVTATAGLAAATATLTVSDNDPANPAIEVTIDLASVLEQTGPAAATGTVTRYLFPMNLPLVVSLASSKFGEATVPATVTIPAGQASATFPIASVDDSVADGPQAVTISASAAAPSEFSGPIAYDTAWGNRGWVYGYARSRLAIQPDGKLVVAGTTGTPGTNADFGVSRYNTNGTLDSTFGSGGQVAIDTTGPSDRPDAVVVQPDGKIVVAGFGTPSVAQLGTMVVVRLTSNGSMDAGFGTGGVVTLDFGGAAVATATDAALQPDGKIVLSGNVGNDFVVVRLDASGSLDPTFDGDGVAVAAFGSAAGGRSYAVSVGADGRIVAAGTSGEGSANPHLALARFNANGSADATFGTGGTVEADFAGYSESGTDVGIQPDGKVVVAATLRSVTTGGNDFAVARYNADGTPDAAFGAGGSVVESVGSAVGGPTRVLVQPDGRILAAGTVGQTQSGTVRVRFLRLTPTGAVETRADSA